MLLLSVFSALPGVVGSEQKKFLGYAEIAGSKALLKRLVSGKDGSRGTPEFFRARFYHSTKIRLSAHFAPAGILLGSAFPKPCYAACAAYTRRPYAAIERRSYHAKEIQHAPPQPCGKNPPVR